MADKGIKGITIKIGGDTVNLQKSLKDVNSTSYSLQSELSQINRLLRFDPSNTELLSQKQKVLSESVENSNEKLRQLENLQGDIERAYKDGEIDNGQYRAYQREIEQTKSKIKSYEDELKSAKVKQQDFDKQVAAARDTLSKTKSELVSGAKKALKWGGAFAAAAGSAGIAGITKLTKDSADATDRIDKLSQKIGVSRTTFQELDFVTSQYGTNVEVLKNALKGMRSDMDTVIQGTNKEATALQRLGVKVSDSNGKMRDSESVMWDAFSALQKWDNEAEKARLASKLFGRAGSELMPMLNSNAESIDDLRKKSHKLGLILSDEAVDSGVEFTDTLDQTQRAAQALGNKLGSKLMPIATDLLKEAQNHLPEIEEFIEGIGNGVSDTIKWTIKNGEKVKHVIKGVAIEAGTIYTAVKVNKLSRKIGETVQAISTLRAATQAQKAATVSATAATEAQTVAQEGLNIAQKANVIGAVVSGLIILGGTLWSAAEASGAFKRETIELTREEKAEIEAIKEQGRELNELKETRKSTLSEVESEFNYYSELASELDNIVDKNGKVKKGYEERADFITNQLSEAFEIEIEKNGDVIQNYKDMRSELDKLIEQKKVAATQEAFSAEYETARKNLEGEEGYERKFYESRNAYKASKKELESRRNAYKAAQKAANDYYKANKSRLMGDTPEVRAYHQLTEALNSSKEKYEEYNKNIFQKRKKSYVDAEKHYTGALAIIKNYDAVSAAILSGNEKKINSALTNLKNDFISSKDGTERTLKNQVENYKTYFEETKQALAEGLPGVTEETVKNAEKMLKKAEKAVANFAKKSGNSVASAYIEGFSEKLNKTLESMGIKGAEKHTILAKAKMQYKKEQRFASGGIVYAPMPAIVGDNKDARRDPEIIAPLSKLRRILNESGNIVRRENRVVNNKPTISVNFGNISVRNQQDINLIADKVTAAVSESLAGLITREGGSMGE